MEKQAGFIQDSQSKAIANVQRQQVPASAAARVTDNRPETITQRKLQDLANTSTQATQLKSLPIQKQSDLEEEKPVQGKFDTTQLVEEEELLQGKFDTIQRAATEDEELLQGKFETVQRVDLEEEKPIQGKFTQPSSPIQRQEEATNNTGLPNQLKTGIESLGGMTMDHVKVHYNSDKPAQLNAHAYAQGSDIHIAPGQEKHLPHEAWHVVQQAQGRVKPTMQMKQGVPVNDDAGLEHEADVMGAKAIAHLEDSHTSLDFQINNQSNIAQLQPMNVEVTGITHLVKPQEGSIFEGTEEIEVSDGDKLTIEPELSLWSRRGPNQEDRQNRLEDATGPQIYEWYPVYDTSKKFYLRDETFIVPEELVVNKQAISEGEGAIERAEQSLLKKQKKPEPPKVTSGKTPEHIIKKQQLDYERNLEKWKLSQGAGPSLEIVLQSIGTTFEDCAFPFICKKHPNAIIYNSLAFASDAELDFVVVEGDDVILYSSKLNPSQFDANQDLSHWSKICQNWGGKKFKSVRGADLKKCPSNPPLVLLVSAATFGLDSQSFLSQLVPNWRTRMGL